MKSFQKIVTMIIMIFVSKTAVAAPQNAVRSSIALNSDSSNTKIGRDPAAFGTSSPLNATIISDTTSQAASSNNDNSLPQNSVNTDHHLPRHFPEYPTVSEPEPIINSSSNTIGFVGNQIGTASDDIDPVSVNGEHGGGVYHIETSANPPGGGDISITTIGSVGNQINTTSGNINPISITYKDST